MISNSVYEVSMAICANTKTQYITLPANGRLHILGDCQTWKEMCLSWLRAENRRSKDKYVGWNLACSQRDAGYVSRLCFTTYL